MAEGVLLDVLVVSVLNICYMEFEPRQEFSRSSWPEIAGAEFDRAAHAERLVHHQLFEELLSRSSEYSSVPLGDDNLRRLIEFTGGELPDYLFARETHDTDPEAQVCPVLPCVRRADDLYHERLTKAKGGDHQSYISTVDPENTFFWPDSDRVALHTNKPYEVTVTRSSDPSLLLTRELERLAREKTGSGHKSAKGLYWRVTLLDTILRFAEGRVAGNYNDTFQSVNTLARKCGVQLHNTANRWRREIYLDETSRP